MEYRAIGRKVGGGQQQCVGRRGAAGSGRRAGCYSEDFVPIVKSGAPKIKNPVLRKRKHVKTMKNNVFVATAKISINMCVKNAFLLEDFALIRARAGPIRAHMGPCGPLSAHMGSKAFKRYVNKFIQLGPLKGLSPCLK